MPEFACDVHAAAERVEDLFEPSLVGLQIGRELEENGPELGSEAGRVAQQPGDRFRGDRASAFDGSGICWLSR